MMVTSLMSGGIIYGDFAFSLFQESALGSEFLFPDGDVLFDAVDEVSATGEGFVPVGAGGGSNNGDVSGVEFSESVCEGDFGGEEPVCFFGDGLHLRKRHIFICGVEDLGGYFPIGEVSYGADEEGNAPVL